MKYTLFERIKRFLGLEKFSSYVTDYFETSNIRSSLYVSTVVIILESWMIISVLLRQISETTRRSTSWLLSHISCYIILLLSALALFIYSIHYLKKQKRNQRLGQVIRIIFSVISIAFGIYISFMDYKKGEQFITLMTMTLFIFCFITWRPIFTILFLSLSYSIFFFLCNSVSPATYATKVNLSIVLISIFMSAINSYHQKINEAKKDDRLEHTHNILLKLSISDELTGIANMNYFRSRALEIIKNKDTDISKQLFLFLDIENFKNYNEKYNFWDGNNFLKIFAEKIEEIFKGSLTAHFSNDNFVILTQDEDVLKKIDLLRNFIINSETEIRMGLKVGAYRPESKDILPIIACDYARLACNSIKKHYDRNYCEYNKKMSEQFHKKQYIINNIDNALANDYIKVYYQPVIDSATGKVCSSEALARWIDPDFGFLSPADFINTLEEYHQIHKLDMYILEKICIDIQEEIKNNKKIIPTSLNISRLDFDSINIMEKLEEALNKYQIEKKFIHIEITESALSENDDKLQQEIQELRKAGYSLWLDDFGAGYSGLNVLKEYDFDVMKIDMKFLSNFNGNEKARQILKNVINLANELGMKTLTEGVETEEAKSFLQDIGCECLQGYLFGKPMPKEEFKEKIEKGEYQLE
ncbi:MAG: EAL domain-containing protein [Treponema sp.]|nr:EAL domain-containing protein [Treponema sp.]